MKSYSPRIVFMGTPEFAVEPLKSLAQAGIEIAGVVTSPDKPAGRGKKLKSSAVKEYSQNHLSCPLFQPPNLKDPDFINALKSLKSDMFVVVAFRMLPEAVWKIPRLGTINLHASLLPQYRGAAPINWALINGENVTGITTFLINEVIDTGQILLQARVVIDPEDNAGSLHDKLMIEGSELLKKTVSHLYAGTIEPVDQKLFQIPENELKKAPKIFKEDCQVNWKSSCQEIHNRVRGLSPYPGAFTIISHPGAGDEQLKIFKSSMLIESHTHLPGNIISDNKHYVRVAAVDGFIDIIEIQAAGKKRMLIGDYLRGIHHDIQESICK